MAQTSQNRERPRPAQLRRVRRKCTGKHNGPNTTTADQTLASGQDLASRSPLNRLKSLRTMVAGTAILSAKLKA